MGRLLRIAILLLGCSLLAACQDRHPKPALTVGVSRCHHCGEVIADKSWAAADFAPSGETRLYDDPGCLILTRREGGGFDGSLIFQDRGDSGVWIEAANAWFANILGIKSPRGYGWGAYTSFADAQAAVTKAGSGRIVRYDQVIELAAAEPSGPAKK